MTGPSVPDPSVGGEASGVLWQAMRYALGRATYAPSEVLQALVEHAHRLLPWQRERMAGEIREAIDAGRAGWDCDVRVWRDALTVLADPPRPARAEVEVAYSPESGMVHRRLDDGRWYVLDVVPGDYGSAEPPAGSLLLGHTTTDTTREG